MLRFEHALRNDDDLHDEPVAAPLGDDQVPQHVRSWCPMMELLVMQPLVVPTAPLLLLMVHG